jgi:DNA-binding PadR family transcriptional regulator
MQEAATAGRRQYGRPFAKGQFKFIVLRLLAEQPRHGYDLIRDLEERLAGRYTPSPGVLYPTLQMLEDLGYVQAQEREGRRIYTVTDTGHRYLDEQRAIVEEAWAHLMGWAEPAGQDALHELRHRLRDLGHILGPRGYWRWVPTDKIPRIREVVIRAQREIEAILAE